MGESAVDGRLDEIGRQEGKRDRFVDLSDADETDHPRCPQVEGEFELSGLLNRKIGWFLAVRDSIDIFGRALEAVIVIVTVIDKGTVIYGPNEAVNGRRAIA